MATLVGIKLVWIIYHVYDYVFALVCSLEACTEFLLGLVLSCLSCIWTKQLKV